MQILYLMSHKCKEYDHEYVQIFSSIIFSSKLAIRKIRLIIVSTEIIELKSKKISNMC